MSPGAEPSAGKSRLSLAQGSVHLWVFAPSSLGLCLPPRLLRGGCWWRSGDWSGVGRDFSSAPVWELQPSGHPATRSGNVPILRPDLADLLFNYACLSSFKLIEPTACAYNEGGALTQRAFESAGLHFRSPLAPETSKAVVFIEELNTHRKQRRRTICNYHWG